MTPDRWTLALEAGEFSLPDGPCLVMRARGDGDFAALGAADDLLQDASLIIALDSGTR